MSVWYDTLQVDPADHSRICTASAEHIQRFKDLVIRTQAQEEGEEA